jgi:hypothetical protein
MLLADGDDDDDNVFGTNECVVHHDELALFRMTNYISTSTIKITARVLSLPESRAARRAFDTHGGSTKHSHICQ